MSSLLLALPLFVLGTSPEPALPGGVLLGGAEEARDVIVRVRGSSPVPVGEVLSTLDGSTFRLRRRYRRVPAFAGRATLRVLRALASDPRVASIEPDLAGRAFTAESAAVIGAQAARVELGLTGRGVTVAVLDTGVDAVHPDLDGGVIAQRCFAQGGCPPEQADTGPSAAEGNGHGTHVSAIVAGRGAAGPTGVAPGASVVVVRVFDDRAVGRVSDWAAALDWVAEHRAELGIRVVNMSLGTDAVFGGRCDDEQPALAAAVELLRAAGVIVFAATGNDGRADAMSAPACLEGVVAVGATYDDAFERQPGSGTYACGCADEAPDAGTLACFTNGGSALDLLAPGARIIAAAPGGRLAEKAGTSQASPHAAGAAALLLEADARLGPSELEGVLKATGQPVVDPRSGSTHRLIDVRAAVAAVQATYCERRGEGEACPLALGCDGGPCQAGRCRSGACAIVLAGVEALPAATGGCAAAGAGSLGAWLTGLVVALAMVRRRPPRLCPARHAHHHPRRTPRRPRTSPLRHRRPRRH